VRTFSDAHVSQPAVVLTNYVLAAESMILAALLTGQPTSRPDLRLWFVVLFVATGLASALGGAVHGVFVARSSPLGSALWRGTLVAIGIAAASGWMIGAEVLWGGAHAGWMLTFVAAELLVYAVVVMAVSDAFWVAIANYLAATGFLLFAYWAAYQSHPSNAIGVGLAGLAFTLVAALGQHRRVGIHPVYFDQNALYHVIQGIALVMIFWSARYLVSL
jgi:hypothetical protein